MRILEHRDAIVLVANQFLHEAVFATAIDHSRHTVAVRVHRFAF